MCEETRAGRAIEEKELSSAQRCCKAGVAQSCASPEDRQRDRGVRGAGVGVEALHVLLHRLWVNTH